ncbi:hypothetical protein HDV00_011250 [Rhizophlyctis rosea]|nr:hypothetical protein HDV00_011250 [Rhizophlyctis rosea]
MHDLHARESTATSTYTSPPGILATATGSLGVSALMVFRQLLLIIFSISVTFLLPHARRSELDWDLSDSYGIRFPWRRRNGHSARISIGERLRKVKTGIMRLCHWRSSRVGHGGEPPFRNRNNILDVENVHAWGYNGRYNDSTTGRSSKDVFWGRTCFILEHLLFVYHFYCASIYLLSHSFFTSPPPPYNPVIPVVTAMTLLYLPRRTIPVKITFAMASLVSVSMLFPTSVLGWVKGFPSTGAAVYMWTNQSFTLEDRVQKGFQKPFTPYRSIYEPGFRYDDPDVTIISRSLSSCTTGVTMPHALQMTYYNASNPMTNGNNSNLQPPPSNGLTCSLQATTADRCIAYVTDAISFVGITMQSVNTATSLGIGGPMAAVLTCIVLFIGVLLIILPTTMAREGLGQSAPLSFVWCTDREYESCSVVSIAEVKP